ncbi:MAG: polysaccharide deacetylase family protein [Bacilli bacterium]|nr:polysaccharide deacetylase family protein [Bacilli bacterium]
MEKKLFFLDIDVSEWISLPLFSGKKKEGKETIEHGVSALLELLGIKGVHATFFIDPNIIDGNKELLLKIISEGHELALAGTMDLENPVQNPDEFARWVSESYAEFQDKLGVSPSGYRPSNFSLKKEFYNVLTDLGFTYIVIGDSYSPSSEILSLSGDALMERIKLKDNTYTFFPNLGKHLLRKVSLTSGTNLRISGSGYFHRVENAIRNEKTFSLSLKPYEFSEEKIEGLSKTENKYINEFKAGFATKISEIIDLAKVNQFNIYSHLEYINEYVEASQTQN